MVTTRLPRLEPQSSDPAFNYSKMAVDWVTPTIMCAQAIGLALIGRLRWRCYPDPETGRCTMLSGCTEHSLQENGGVDASEFCINDQKVLLVSSKIN